MILECALLDVRPGLESDFEAAFRQARPLVEGQPGFRSVRLDRCLENGSRYLLRIEWDTLEDHVEGFRASPEFPAWRALLHHFYDPVPVVQHFEAVSS